MRPLKELNLSNVRVPPSELEVSNLENKLDARLPVSYLGFLREGNGGSPELDTFEMPSGEEWSVNDFFFVGPDDASTESVIWNYLNRWDGIPDHFLPIGRDGGGNLFLLNVSPKYKDEVWIWLHDEPNNQLRQLCGHFDDFIDGLKMNPNYI